MKNMFENAYFGKAYKTRDGRKALYITTRSFDKKGELIDVEVENDGRGIRVFPNGKLQSINMCEHSECESYLDIVSEWQEEISEEELEKLAETEANNTVGEWRYGSTDLPKWHGFKEGFKVGLRKALEYINNNKK